MLAAASSCFEREGTAKDLAYGVSITDACAGIDDAARSLSALGEGAARARNKR